MVITMQVKFMMYVCMYVCMYVDCDRACMSCTVVEVLEYYIHVRLCCSMSCTVVVEVVEKVTVCCISDDGQPCLLIDGHGHQCLSADI